MKQVLTSAGILALGAVTLHAYDPELTRQRSGRPFSIAATVRGIYDDNIATNPDGLKQDSVGVQVSPSIHLNLPLQQTFISLGYAYSLIWYENREPDNNDQTHDFNGKLRHRFGPQSDVSVDESFVYTTEPTIADRGGIITAPQRLRTQSDILHNRASIDGNIGLTRQLGLGLGYGNNWYDYEQEGFGSRSALLDRVEHLFRIDLRDTINPNLVALIGYNFGVSSYSGDDFLSTTGAGPKSDARDSYSHYGYVGADYDLTARLRASVRLGIQYTDYHEVGDSSLSPYADASVTYVYMTGSSAQLGLRHSRNATDIVTADLSGSPTLDAETTGVYAQVTQQITPNFTAIVMGQYQISDYNGGANDSRTEDLLLLGLNLEYRFSRHWAAEAGYNYDLLDSQVIDHANRSYDRNRFYLGVRATY